MDNHRFSQEIRFPIIGSEAAAVPSLQRQQSSKPPRQFLTYKESCGVTKPLAMISADALIMALEQTLRISKASPHWSAQERKGAIAMVIHLNEHFELGMESRAPYEPTSAE